MRNHGASSALTPAMVATASQTDAVDASSSELNVSE